MNVIKLYFLDGIGLALIQVGFNWDVISANKGTCNLNLCVTFSPDPEITKCYAVTGGDNSAITMWNKQGQVIGTVTGMNLRRKAMNFLFI